jgi:hypothetical protein
MLASQHMPAPWPDRIWEDPAIVEWSRLLAASFQRWTGKNLVSANANATELAGELFFAPFIVASHTPEADPVLNYGNRTALTLWETDWERFIQIPSRLTAEPVNQEARERMLAEAARQGYVSGYGGVRISTTGRRFQIEDAIVWNVVDTHDNLLGQAATFDRWRFIDT